MVEIPDILVNVEEDIETVREDGFMRVCGVYINMSSIVAVYVKDHRLIIDTSGRVYSVGIGSELDYEEVVDDVMDIIYRVN